jgi:DNA modification methylase
VPFKSEKQKKFLFANKPEIAKRWAKNYNKGPDINILTSAKRDETDHSCGKPLVFLDWIIERFSEKDNFLYDPFIGSGSTLIACEKTNRKCYGMELDPHYCDVIVKRWEEYTGNKAERVEAASA